MLSSRILGQQSWTDRGDVKDLRAAFADWDPIYAPLLKPLTRRSFGGCSIEPRCHAVAPLYAAVTLLGDADSPDSSPVMAPPGAAQALEDGGQKLDKYVSQQNEAMWQ